LPCCHSRAGGNPENGKIRLFTKPSNKIKSQLFGTWNFRHCDLFDICDLLFGFFLTAET
jgi:hypothetical protein